MYLIDLSNFCTRQVYQQFHRQGAGHGNNWLMMRSMFKSPVVSALSPFFLKYFSLWPLVTFSGWSTGSGWERCGVGPVQAGETLALAVEGACRTGGCWEWPRKQRRKDRGGETSWGHMCVSAGLGRAWVTQGNWRSVGGLGLHLRPQLGSMHVSMSLRCMTSHTWLQRWNVTLEMLLSCCPSYSS